VNEFRRCVTARATTKPLDQMRTNSVGRRARALADFMDPQDRFFPKMTAMGCTRDLKTGRQTTIYSQVDTGDVSSKWAGEKGDGIRNLVQFTHSADRNLSK